MVKVAATKETVKKISLCLLNQKWMGSRWTRKFEQKVGPEQKRNNP